MNPPQENNAVDLPFLQAIWPGNAGRLGPPEAAELKKLGTLFFGSAMLGLGASIVKLLGSLNDSPVPLPFYILIGVYLCYRVHPVMSTITNMLRNDIDGQQSYTSGIKSSAIVITGFLIGYLIGYCKQQRIMMERI